MRLIYFTRDYSPHDQRFLKVISKSEYEVFLLRLEGKSLSQRGIKLPAKITELEWKTPLENRMQKRIEDLRDELNTIFDEVKPGLVHAGPLPDCAYLASLTGFKPLVGMSWGFDLLQDVDLSAEAYQRTQKALSASGALLVDCQTSVHKAVTMGFPVEKIVTFPWGVDLGHFSPGDESHLRKKLGWENDIVILCNRSWEPRYGVDIVLKAFFEAANKNPNLRLLLVGDGTLAGEFKEIIAKSDVEDRIHTPGRITLEELPEYYRAADLYVSASHVDGSSVSLLEAMACGRPVAVSDIPANLEWVQDGTNGWVFPDGDDAALSQIICTAGGSQPKLKGLGEQNRKDMQEKAEWNRNSQKLFEAYAMALEGSR